MKLPDFIKKPLTGLALLAAATSANAGVTTDLQVGNYNNLDNGFNYTLAITNTYPDITFDSGLVKSDFINGLADSIANYNPNVDKQSVVDELNSTIGFFPTSDYNGSTGWFNSITPAGDIELTNNGIIPGVTYNEWNQDGTAVLHGFVNADLLDVDGVTGYNPVTDLGLRIDSLNPYINGVIGTSTNNLRYGGDLDRLEATPVPEPSSLALVGMGALALSGYRKRK